MDGRRCESESVSRGHQDMQSNVNTLELRLEAGLTHPQSRSSLPMHVGTHRPLSLFMRVVTWR